MQYVGQTKRVLKTRFWEHFRKMKSLKILILFFTDISGELAIHDHLIIFWFNPLKKIIYKPNSSERFKNILRREIELKVIKLLQTHFPLGFNDNIYYEGNISQMPYFDVFSRVDKKKKKKKKKR